ncbi:MAG TPA: DUF433 domain-containing protein [Mucilaginibacter sp.]|jgi:uncharacterized protein (DUF433 family)
MATKEIENIQAKVGEGIYSKRDVADILHLPYHKVSRWMNDFWSDYTFGNAENKLINFKTLIEFYTFYHLRENGFSSQHTKAIHASIAKDLNTPYPFATKIHFINSENLKSKKYVYYEVGDHIIKSDGKKQFDLKPFLIPFLNKIEFNNDEIPIVDKFYPLENSKRIVVDPKLQFGKPTITGTGIKAEVINGFYEGGESKESICKIYNLHIQQVEDAILYFKQTA